MIKFTAINDNFWTAHPDLAIIQPFKDLFLNDKSKEKKTTSDMMWFLVLCYDKGSKFFKLAPEGEDGKYLLVGEDFLGDPNYYFKHANEIDELIERYTKLQMTAIERQLMELEETLDVRRNLIRKLRQSEDTKTWLELDKVIKGTKILTTEIEQMRAKLREEDTTGNTKGGAALSLLD